MQHIHEDYLTAVQDLARRYQPKRILKTDCWNEADGDTPIANVIGAECVEIDSDCVQRAQSKFPGLVATVGDIRVMPYENKIFDMLVDLSTIDHMFDYQVALDEYVRVTKDGGVVYIVVWISADPCDYDREDGSHFDPTGKYRQYYFSEEKFLGSLNRTFKSVIHGVFHHFKGVRTLHWFECVV